MNYKVFIISGPSGIGKTYVYTAMQKMHPNLLIHTRAHTTRQIRSAETTTPIGRTFVSTDTFLWMVSNNDFVIHENFAGNYYGYTKHSVSATTSHILIDVSPWLLPRLTYIKNAVFIGMTPAEHFKPELQKRISQRGDSKEVIAQRLPYIQKDIEDLAMYHNLINSKGKVFVIKNNDTLYYEILPYIIDQMNS